jgi:hypothetical protein
MGHSQVICNNGDFAGNHHRSQDTYEQYFLSPELQERKGKSRQGTSDHLAEHYHRRHDKGVQDHPQKVVIRVYERLDVIDEADRRRQKMAIVYFIGWHN